MECEENGGGVSAVAGRRGVKRKRRGGGPAGASEALAPAPSPAPPLPPAQPPLFPPPFLNVNLMEEITFWICTRRAPCLYRYNNVYKKKIEEAHCSNKHGSEPSFVEEVASPKKKKRKLRLLDDDDSVSSEKQQNVYFEKPHKQYWYSSSESEPEDRSDVDFNINNSYMRNKSKTKSQRKNRTNIHRKNKIVTSTPKPTTLRRSLRKSRQNLNNSSHLNCTFDILNASSMNGEHQLQRENCDDKSKSRYKSHTSNSKKGTILKEQSKNEIMHNGQFEDISDVSGFTANYIRSTKMNSKTPRKVAKPSRNLAKESQQPHIGKDESKIIVCINKSVNAGVPTSALNTESSQNVINLVTVNNNNNGKPLKLNQSTSQLKFLGLKDDQVKETDKDAKRLNISFQSKSSGVLRYPSRHRNNSKVVNQDFENSNKNPTSVKKKVTRGSRELRSINQNENVDISLVSRTRSGKKIGVIDLEESQEPQEQQTNVPEDPSVTKNVATPANKGVGRRKRVVSTKKSIDRGDLRKDSESDKEACVPSSSTPAKCVGRRAGDKTRQSFRKDLVRDKSGFADCFSDSDEDKPLIRRKFFC